MNKIAQFFDEIKKRFQIELIFNALFHLSKENKATTTTTTTTTKKHYFLLYSKLMYLNDKIDILFILTSFTHFQTSAAIFFIFLFCNNYI